MPFDDRSATTPRHAAARELSGYLLAAGLLAGLAILPVGLAPAWAVLAVLQVRYGLAVAPLALAGAAGTAAGKTAVALAARTAGPRVFGRRLSRNVAFAAPRLQSRGGSLAVAGLLVAGPPPQTALYAAAGLLRVNLALVAASCLAGRVANYLVWLGAIGVVATRLPVNVDPWMAAVSTAATAAVVLLLGRLDWAQAAERARRAGGRLRRAPLVPAADAPVPAPEG